LRNKELTIDWLFKNYMPFLQKFQMEEENIRNHFEKWKQNRVPLIGDYLWFIFNFLLHEVVKQSNTEIDIYKKHREIYYEMTQFQRLYENKPANHTYRLYLENDLRLKELESNMLLNVTIISGHCFSYCGL